jgi:hypothetical protein
MWILAGKIKNIIRKNHKIPRKIYGVGKRNYDVFEKAAS